MKCGTTSLFLNSVNSVGHQKELSVRFSFIFVIMSTSWDFHDKQHGIFETGYYGKALYSNINRKHSLNFGMTTLLGMYCHAH